MSRNTEYQFVSTNADELISKLTSAYETITGHTLQPADPDKLFLQWIADAAIQERCKQNYTGNQNIPSRAEGINLDAIGEFIYGLARLQAQSAKCTVRFTISAAQSTSILIPSGTRVTDSSYGLIWQTTADAYIAVGDLYADVMVQCQVAGIIGNGYVAGQINTLIDVDNIRYYSSCENTDTSDGGSEEATDDEYFDLMRMSLDSFSVAGPSGAYVYWAKSVSTDIADVKAIRPKESVSKTIDVYSDSESDKYSFIGGDHLSENTLAVYAHGGATPATLDTDYSVSYDDGLLKISISETGSLASETQLDVEYERELAGHVYIYALMDDGSIAGSVIKSAVLAACNDENVRPLTDYVSVQDPVVITYNISLTYYIPTDSTISAADIESAVDKAIDEYEAWQCAKLGRDINPSYLVGLLMKTGIKRVVLTSPEYTSLADGSDNGAPRIAHLGTKTVINGGYEDE